MITSEKDFTYVSRNYNNINIRDRLFPSSMSQINNYHYNNPQKILDRLSTDSKK